MGEHVIKLPDVGEGVAEAELVEWHVKVGDLVREDQMLAAVMTDKATVEIPSPVDGEVLWLGAEIGDTVAIGSPIVRLKVAGDGNVREGSPAVEPDSSAKRTPTPSPSPQGGGARGGGAARQIQPVLFQLQCPNHLRMQPVHCMRGRGAKAGEEFLGTRGAADFAGGFQHQHPAAVFGQQGRADQPVVAAADDDCIK